jgi:hypothetical protein
MSGDKSGCNAVPFYTVPTGSVLGRVLVLSSITKSVSMFANLYS